MTEPSQSPRVAYACMEFALDDELPLFAGGLGVLAADVLRQAKDDGLPLVGVGILWGEGYCRQRFDEGGWQREEWAAVAREGLEALPPRASVEIAGRSVPLRAFRRERPDHAPLYLLEPAEAGDRWITRRLYQGGDAARVAQEIVLGVGGVRMLEALGVEVDLWHLNEGHAAFAGLELARREILAGASLEEARRRARQRLVFTTHTPVLAGNESHAVGLLLAQGAGLGCFSGEDLAAIAGDPFNMTVAGLRLSRRANGVAALHAATARRMWEHVEDAAPIVAVTNGVHVPTWQDPRVPAAADAGTLQGLKRVQRAELVAEIRRRGAPPLGDGGLLLGFARRAVPYKRPDLLFRRLDRVAPLLESGRLRLVFGGKAHPDGHDGKQLLARIHDLAVRFEGSVSLVADHDLGLARLLTRGCDAWLNAPRRPQEASGTSGMKAALNGGLNVSVLDGWWAEACLHGANGWQFGSGHEGEGQDEHDATALVDVLEREVLPAHEGDGAHWERLMAAAVETAASGFSAARMVRDYRRRMWASREHRAG